ncbi:hypothetical protein [Posidoniimonas polymericola]|uniref:hypothetical protein n=1 Tax=Posidoniimonas polymericola TaxID=2528002 RepID=UPI0011B72544|nr:hypothetical protein [Posidoniimonas polymericola]
MADTRYQLDQTIRDTLLRSWDPIGVRANPEARDEYDSYIPTIAEILLADADQYALGRHLTKLEHSSMGLPGNPPRCDRAARALLIAYHRCLLCAALNDIIDSEIKNGNAILETSKGWPDENSVFVRLARPVTAKTPDGMDRRDVNDPHYWQAEIYDHRSGHIIAW